MDAPEEEDVSTCEETLVEIGNDRLPGLPGDGLAKFVEVDGECYLVFPEGLCEKAGWDTGDTLVIERVAKARALIIRKKEPQPTTGG